MTVWSIVTLSQVSLLGKASFYTCRALLGILEVSTANMIGYKQIFMLVLGGFTHDLVL
jgi:hypothetical protein